MDGRAPCRANARPVVLPVAPPPPASGRFEQNVRVRLQPRYRHGRYRRLAIRCSLVARHGLTPAVPFEMVETGVGGDPVEPGPVGRRSAVGLPFLPRPHECLLDQVLRLVVRTEQSIAVCAQLRPVGLGQTGEGRAVPVPRRGDHIALVARAGHRVNHVSVTSASSWCETPALTPPIAPVSPCDDPTATYSSVSSLGVEPLKCDDRGRSGSRPAGDCYRPARSCRICRTLGERTRHDMEKCSSPREID
jgi:hypothetical protein